MLDNWCERNGSFDMTNNIIGTVDIPHISTQFLFSDISKKVPNFTDGKYMKYYLDIRSILHCLKLIISIPKSGCFKLLKRI